MKDLIIIVGGRTDAEAIEAAQRHPKSIPVLVVDDVPHRLSSAEEVLAELQKDLNRMDAELESTLQRESLAQRLSRLRKPHVPRPGPKKFQHGWTNDK